jgi:hypothetical protein
VAVVEGAGQNLLDDRRHQQRTQSALLLLLAFHAGRLRCTLITAWRPAKRFFVAVQADDFAHDLNGIFKWYQ